MSPSGSRFATIRSIAPAGSRVLKWEATTAERAGVQRELDALVGEVATVERQISEMRFDENRLRTRLGVIAPSPLKTYFRDAPLLDFMAPTLKVQQVILPNIVDDVNFNRVPKMDRCQTCHLAIDRQGYEEYPQPFRTHPNLDQYIGSASLIHNTTTIARIAASRCAGPSSGSGANHSAAKATGAIASPHVDHLRVMIPPACRCEGRGGRSRDRPPPCAGYV